MKSAFEAAVGETEGERISLEEEEPKIEKAPVNRPRIVGERKSFPSASTPRRSESHQHESKRAMGMLEELEQAKGKRVETDKRKLDGRPKQPDRPPRPPASAPVIEPSRSATVFKSSVSSVNHEHSAKSDLKPIMPGQKITFGEE